ncbi:MAG: hypothetical protein H6985_10750 [Pseudomonadales bacterium]|nr:hypothetical protein [Pseudomonadales bacterium]
MNGLRPRAGQRGMVLAISLLVLLILSLVATTVARTNRLQLHMAGNDEARIAAMQRALAVADSVLPVAIAPGRPAQVGYRLCTALSTDTRCDERTITLDPSVQTAIGSLDVAVVRVAPLQDRLPVMAEAKASSTVHYRAARIEVQVAYDGSSGGRGRAMLTQGLLVRLPAAP